MSCYSAPYFSQAIQNGIDYIFQWLISVLLGSMNIVDNYDDMRIRFFRDVENFRTIANISKEKALTFVIDRAIYSREVFEYMTELTNTHIITWEKDYKHDKWKI